MGFADKYPPRLGGPLGVWLSGLFFNQPRREPYHIRLRVHSKAGVITLLNVPPCNPLKGGGPLVLGPPQGGICSAINISWAPSRGGYALHRRLVAP
jgi:hypothetical protein